MHGGNLLDQTTCNNNYRSLSSKASRRYFAKTAETKCQRDKHDPENKGVCSDPKYDCQSSDAGKDKNKQPRTK